MTRLHCIIIVFICALIGGNAHAGGIIYVDVDAAGLGDGTAWCDAYTTLQDAIVAAVPGNTIRIAQGTYYPDEGGGQTPNSRMSSFTLVSGVIWEGGYAGCGEVDPDARDIETFVTTLSGDLQQDDAGGVAAADLLAELTRLDNAYEVIIADSTDATAVIDGFTVRAGHANELVGGPVGGAIRMSSGSPVIQDCVFLDNAADLAGGAIYGDTDSNPLIQRCRFENNATSPGSLGIGAGVYSTGHTNVVIRDCTFQDNAAGVGGGIGTNAGGAVVVSRCVFLNNTSTTDGGAFSAGGSTGDTLTNCAFYGNSAIEQGGGVYLGMGTVATLVNCVFSGNIAEDGAGLGASSHEEFTMVNCSISGNTASDSGGAIFAEFGTTASVTNSVVWGNTANTNVSVGGGDALIINHTVIEGGWGGPGGTSIFTGDPMFVDLDGDDDTIGTIDDNLRLQEASNAENAGDDAAVPLDVGDVDGDLDTAEVTPLDLDLTVRFIGTVDIGCYERSGGDCNGNGIPDEDDLADCPGDPDCDDCDGNGIPDECDIASCDSGSNPSCDDCNLNSIPDGCDITNATSLDVDMNGIPDECEDFTGGCGLDNNWTCPANWDLAGQYPDNEPGDGVPDIHATVNAFDVVVDEDIIVDTLRLQDGAVMRVTTDDPVQGDFVTEAAGGILVQSAPGQTSELVLDNDRVLDVSLGSLDILEGGALRPEDPGADASSGMLTAASVLVAGGFCDTASQGSIQLAGDMTAGAGVIVLSEPDGGDNPDCCPPDLFVLDFADVTTGDMIIDGPAHIDYASAVPLTVTGNFENSSTAPEIFDWDGGLLAGCNFGMSDTCGGIVMTGITTQSFEVAGEDRGANPIGFDTNFDLGYFEVADSADVQLIDTFDNDQAGQGLCTEALYVERLVLGPNASLTLENCNLYYLSIDQDPTSQIVLSGCSTHESVTPAVIPFDCADLDNDGARDDNCRWFSVEDGACEGVQLGAFADMGGPFGQCNLDGAADGNDRFHALNCFANSDPNNLPPAGYPCEPDPPNAANVDAGGPFGGCAPDGVCDGNDAFHALNSFADTTTCTCPATGAQPMYAPPIAQQARLSLATSKSVMKPGDVVEVDVYLDSYLDDLRGYQLHLGVEGGFAGGLELVDIVLGKTNVLDAGPGERRRKSPGSDWRTTTPGAPSASVYWSAFNTHTHQMVVGLDTPGIPVRPGYLATFAFRASADARGKFTVELLHDKNDLSHRTFLFPSAPNGMIAVRSAPPVVLSVGDR